MLNCRVFARRKNSCPHLTLRKQVIGLSRPRGRQEFGSSLDDPLERDTQWLELTIKRNCSIGTFGKNQAQILLKGFAVGRKRDLGFVREPNHIPRLPSAKLGWINRKFRK